jgi:hypothetical protein
MRKMLRKRTKVLLLFAYVTIGFFLFLAYEDVRRAREIEADWHGQEAAVEALELPIGPSTETRVMFLAATALAVTSAACVVLDLRTFRKQLRTGAAGI